MLCGWERLVFVLEESFIRLEVCHNLHFDFLFVQIKSPQKFQEQYEVDEVLYVDQIVQYLKGLFLRSGKSLNNFEK
jgi:hypothetical protein